MLELSSKAARAAVMIRQPLVIHPALRWSTSQRAAPSSLIQRKSREAARCGCGGMIPRAAITRSSRRPRRRPLTVHYPIRQSAMPTVSMTGSWSQTDIKSRPEGVDNRLGMGALGAHRHNRGQRPKGCTQSDVEARSTFQAEESLAFVQRYHHWADGSRNIFERTRDIRRRLEGGGTSPAEHEESGFNRGLKRGSQHAHGRLLAVEGTVGIA